MEQTSRSVLCCFRKRWKNSYENSRFGYKKRRVKLVQNWQKNVQKRQKIKLLLLRKN